MDIMHFNRGLRRIAQTAFEDVVFAGEDDPAAYTLDADFESLGERTGEFQLVPGVICRPRSDGMVLAPERRLDP